MAVDMNTSMVSGPHGGKNGSMPGSTLAFHIIDFSVCAIGVVLNCVALFVFLKHNKLRSPENVHIMSLTISGLMLALTAAPTTLIAEYSFNVDVSPFTCMLCTVCLKFYYCGVDIHNLAAISLIRYSRVIDPDGFRQRKRRFRYTTLILVVLSWTMPALYSLLAYLFVESDWVMKDTNCSFKILRSNTVFKFMLYAVITPLLVVIFCIYGFIFHRVRATHKDAGAITYDKLIKQREETQRARFYVALVFFAAVCWLPIYVFNVVGINDSNRYLVKISVVLCHFNTVGNTFLYAFAYPEFKTALVAVCFKRSYETLPGVVTRGNRPRK